MMNGAERETFALRVMEEVRRWPGVELRPHASPHEPEESDGIEFRLFGRQFGHVHGDCAVHVGLTRALKAGVVQELLAENLDFAPTSGWAQFHPMTPGDAEHAIWLLRLNYVRLRRQRLSPQAALKSELVQKHEQALGAVSPGIAKVLQRTQLRSRPRPIPSLEAVADAAAQASASALADGFSALRNPHSDEPITSATPTAVTARAML